MTIDHGALCLRARDRRFGLPMLRSRPASAIEHAR
jgi:hypothetical protein